MHLVLIGLFVVLFGLDAIDPPPRWADADAWTPLWVLGPKAALLLIYGLLCRRTLRLLQTQRAHRAHRRLERATAAFTLALLPLFVGDVLVGGADAVRGWLGDLVLLDELVLMGPTLAVAVAGWALYYPVDRALREAALLSRLDDGRAVYPIWSRGQFLAAQLRHQVLLVLVPLAMVYAWAEVVALLGARGVRWAGPAYQPWLVAGGAGVVLAIAPLIIRHLWDTTPLPPGQIRERLEALCRQYRVGVRELLLWRTHGGMANAAVMGLLAPARYILLTDALLDQATARQVEAVMAHELAHVRRKHMFWLLAAAIGSAGVLELGAYAALDAWVGPHTQPAWWQVAAVAGPALAAWLLAFGWVSRRVERQADTFAAQHLSRDAPDGRITADAADAMAGALRQVAVLNHMRPTRRDWRHGSIAWRQAYLKTLVGRPAAAPPIDRLMLGINLASLAAVACVVWMSARP